MAFAISASFLLSACHSDTDKNKTPKPTNAVTQIEGIVAKTSTIQQLIQSSGSITPFEETVLMPEVAGRVIAINLPEGKFVSKGTLLVKLLDDDLQAQLRRLEVQLKIAETTEQRQSQLIKINGISQQDYDQSVLQVNDLKAQIEILRVTIRKTEIRAPFDGKIGLKKISLGATISPSTPVATIRADQHLKVDFSVPEKYSTELKAGKKLTFTVQGDSKKYEATVLANEESIESSTRNLKVRAIVNGNPTTLTPGAFAEVEVILGENKNALMIPSQAVIPQARDKKVIVSKNGKATFVKVKTGVRKESTVEIIEGISIGDTVVTTGLLFIRPDFDLKFSKITN